MTRWIVLVTAIVFVGNGCNKGTPVADDAALAAQGSNSSSIFSDNLADFEIRVFYETGADPYTGAIGLTTNQTWDITKSSYQALFQNHLGRTLSIPTVIGQMFQIPDQNKLSWSMADLIALGKVYAPSLMYGADARVGVIFLNGKYNGDSSILGLHFTGSPFVFIFKDVVISTGGDSVGQRYVEQATVVHEVGHAIGLVNNGVRMSSPHEDGAHPHHTTNPNCVMYWTIESKANILTSLASSITGNKLQLFGNESLSDARNFHP